MSQFKVKGVRCDFCGKFSNAPLGEYLKPDGVSMGYISQPEWERNHVDASGKHDPIDSEFDICEECTAHRCTFCGSDQLVRIVPMTPGPTGWGFRCKACGKSWNIPEMNDVREAQRIRPVRQPDEETGEGSTRNDS